MTRDQFIEAIHTLRDRPVFYALAMCFDEIETVRAEIAAVKAPEARSQVPPGQCTAETLPVNAQFSVGTATNSVKAVGYKTSPVEADPVCECGHKASEHRQSRNAGGCAWEDGKLYCPCGMARSEVLAAASGQAGEKGQAIGQGPTPLEIATKALYEISGWGNGIPAQRGVNVAITALEAMGEIEVETKPEPAPRPTRIPRSPTMEHHAASDGADMIPGEEHYRPAPQPTPARAPGESSETDAMQPRDDELVKRVDVRRKLEEWGYAPDFTREMIDAIPKAK